MFFTLSKIFSFLITPIVWIVLLVLISFIFRKKKWAKRCFIYTVIVTLFFTNSFISDFAVSLWEYPMTADKDLAPCYDAGIVLGGGMITIDKKYDRLAFRDNVDRILQAVSLYKTGKIKKMIISSGSGNLVLRDMMESSLLKRYFLKIGIPDSVMIVDSLSNNTHQNAVNSAEIINKEFPKGKFLLITSAIHMRRSLACFKKAGVKATPYSTNKLTGKLIFDVGHFIVPNINALDAWDNLIHEVIGYIAYFLWGYI